MRGIARARGGLPVEPGFGDQVAGALLLGGDIHGAFGVGVGQFDQHHLRALQIIAHRDQQHALAGLRVGRPPVCAGCLCPG